MAILILAYGSGTSLLPIQVVVGRDRILVFDTLGIAWAGPDTSVVTVPDAIQGGAADEDEGKRAKPGKRRQVITLPNGMRIVADADKAKALLARAQQSALPGDGIAAPGPAVSERALPSSAPPAVPAGDVTAFAALTGTPKPQPLPAPTVDDGSAVAAAVEAVRVATQAEARRRRDEEETLMLLLAA